MEQSLFKWNVILVEQQLNFPLINGRKKNRGRNFFLFVSPNLTVQSMVSAGNTGQTGT
jgi:hypothetical protein